MTHDLHPRAISRQMYERHLLAGLAVAHLLVVLFVVGFWPSVGSTGRPVDAQQGGMRVVAVELAAPPGGGGGSEGGHGGETATPTPGQPSDNAPPEVVADSVLARRDEPAPDPARAATAPEQAPPQPATLGAGNGLGQASGDGTGTGPGGNAGPGSGPGRGPGVGPGSGPGTGGGAVEAPRAVRFVEPEYPREARRRGIVADVVTELLVDEQGRVVSTHITKRFLLRGRDRTPQAVDSLGYGLEEAVRRAAQNWQFRPGRSNGKPVRAPVTITFRFGTD